MTDFSWQGLTFLWPWMFVLLLLPFIARFFLTTQEKGLGGALKVPFYSQLSAITQGGNNNQAPQWWKALLLVLIWVLLVTALARPTLVGKEIPLPAKGRDIMLAIDLSGSMQERDLAGRRLNRLDVVKEAADNFISRRKGDRMGLILFSERAYLQAPLTFDRRVVRQLLTEAQVGLTGQKTAIGDAIAIGLKRLKDRPKGDNAESRVLVLLTDGANNAGVMPPTQAAQLAKKLGIKVYTIGVGGEAKVANTIFGKRVVNPSRDLDEPTLINIAKTTGGQYFRATDSKTLDNIYREIDKLEPSTSESLIVRPEKPLFYYPAIGAIILAGFFALALLLSDAWRKRL